VSGIIHDMETAVTTLNPPKKRTPNGHDHDVGLATDVATEKCPWCQQPISRSEYNSIRKEISERERARVAQVEKQATAKAEAAIAQAKKDAAATAQAQIKAFRANQEAVIAQRVLSAREAAEKKLAEAVTAAVGQEKQRSFAEKLRLQEQLQAVQRKLEQRTSNSLGDEAEIDLHAAIRAEWSIDEMIVEKIPKGRNGVDVIAHVLQRGETVGRVAIDSKNVSRWSNRWIGKMASDVIQTKSDFGIISTTAFRNGGARQIDVIDGIIACHPARVVTLIHLLRRQIIAMHVLRLGNEARDDKKDKLYTFLTSDRAAQLLGMIAALTENLMTLDEKERSSHLTVWNRRSELIKGLQGARNEFGTEIDEIVTGAATEASS
jgi:hypothetical protein